MQRYSKRVSQVLIGCCLCLLGYAATSGKKDATTNSRLPKRSKTITDAAGPKTQPAARIFHADIKGGFIGVPAGSHIDNPYDNVFHIFLPEAPSQGETVTLQYTLKGVADKYSIPRSVNRSLSSGGHFITKSDQWTNQQEILPNAILHRGDNAIYFHALENIEYQVADVKLQLRHTEPGALLTVNTATNYTDKSTSYISGIANTQGKLFCNGVPVDLRDGQFEIVLNNPNPVGKQLTAVLSLILPSGKKVIKKVGLNQNNRVDISIPFQETGNTATGRSMGKTPLRLMLKSNRFVAWVSIPAGSMENGRAATLTALRKTDMPPISSDIINVTGGAESYRLVAGTNRSLKRVHVSLPYDTVKIPEGYSQSDIRTFFFDAQKREWIAIPADSIDIRAQTIQSFIDNSSDMINGIIKVPESPQTQGYTPTFIKDYKAADPSNGIVTIAAPKANNMGTNSLSFPLKLPKGRLGLQPSLAVQYNHEAGNGWMGMGWNLAVPSISIDTRWGVPRYSTQDETETYVFSGEQLAPIANRTALVPRVADRQFHLRIEGSFKKIIRHGDRPSNYWWEVTDKNGIRNFYGGRPGKGALAGAVLKDDQGNIGQWQLVETRDLHDNFVLYQYSIVSDPGLAGGAVSGTQIYLDKINYTGSGQLPGPYEVSFLRSSQTGATRRKDVEISSRLGFKMVTAERLETVKISLGAQAIRSYALNYSEGEFYKTLLRGISEIDKDGTVFYTHSFDYFDDVKANGGNVLSPIEAWNIPNDNITGNFTNPLSSFSDEGSALSTVKSTGHAAGLALTIGFGNFENNKNLTIGGSVGTESGDGEGLVSMVDINGDGLPDKVFKKGGVLSFRPNLGGSRAFGPISPINGINDFSRSTSKTTKKGVQIIPPFTFLGSENSTVTTKTTTYFSDFNGDGLVDLAADGLVYFNHLDGNNNPVFEPSSTNTPNPILATSYLDPSLFAPDKALEKEQDAQYPLQDAVRFWQAPFAGRIRIDAPVQLLPATHSGFIAPKQDGVTVSIETANARNWSARINAGDYTIKVPSNVGSIPVFAGQKIFFRVQSFYNGDGDKVSWNPEITYLSPFKAQTDANNRRTDFYKSSDDFVLDNKNGVRMPKTGDIVIDGSFGKNTTSDDVSLLVVRMRQGKLDTVNSHSYLSSAIIRPSVTQDTIGVLEGDQLYFKITTDSHTDRTQINWQPHYRYVSFTDATPILNLNGTPLFEGFVVPDNSNYNETDKLGDVFVSSASENIEIMPHSNLNSSANGDVTFTVKGINKLYAKKTLKIVGGKILPLSGSIFLNVTANQPYYFDFATSDSLLAKAINDRKATNQVDVTIKGGGVSQTINAGLYIEPPVDYLGSLYRGWGQFSYKGDKPNQVIDDTKLNFNQYGTYPTDANSPAYNEPVVRDSLPDPTLSEFVPMYADSKTNSWIGLDSAVFVSANTISSSRLFLHDVTADDLVIGSGLFAATKIGVSKIHSFAFSGGYGGISAGRSTSTATTTTQLDMMDMNGDRYPDVQAQDNIQYTQPNGSLGPVFDNPHGLGGSKSEGDADGSNLGGHYTQAKADNRPSTNSFSEQAKANASIGLAGNVGTNDDHGSNVWLDVNGDGLPDKVFDDGMVALNLGYKFAGLEQWGITAIDKSKSKSIGGGANAGTGAGVFSDLGKNIVSGSFEAGFSLTRSNSQGSYTLNDINGDGLIDQIYDDGVQLNTGNGFEQKRPWNSLADFNNNVSTGESANVAFTISIPVTLFIPIKICINPSFSAQHGISREQDQIMDIDGDGLPDILHSDNDGNLTVRHSLIGRTNLLSAVHGPMGSSFKVDYQRIGNSYNLPQNKWVLTKVIEFDGVSGDGPDSTQINIAYKDGFYNRKEREFYGFASVQTDQLNTANRNEIYRSNINEYFNDDYYRKGLVTKEWLQDANGNKFTETDNQYKKISVRQDVEFYALTSVYRLIYEGQKNPGATTYTLFNYDAFGNIIRIDDAGDNSAQDLTIAIISYHDNPGLYLKNIPKSIVVNTINGEKRRRSTLINNFGDITEIDQYLADGTKSVFDLAYDPFGNLSQVKRPANYKCERMSYSYEYETAVHTYVTRVKDAYGYSSTSQYEYLFGNTVSTVSMNDEPMQFAIDSRGRIKSVTGPYEIEAKKPYTIAFEYFPAAAIPYAITHHFDPEHNGDINIVTFMDGFGRNIQVKKTVSLFSGNGKPDNLKMVVSGRNLFDAFGRSTRSYYPILENISGTNGSFNAGFGKTNEITVYDVMDRPLKQTLADGAATSFAYKASANLLTATMTDALKNVTEIVSDIKDRKREERKLSGPAGPIATRFDYNAVSELIAVTDNGGNITSYSYDNLGRRISATYPDAGEIGFTYDPAGNMIKKQTAQIKKEFPKDGGINYEYEFERLTGIDYPLQYQNKVTYKYGGPGMGDRTGRLILQEDASGGLEYYYGKLGEVTKQIRSVLINRALFKTFVSEQTYDTWNRVKKMTYPDGEVVSYHYNQGGGLQSIEGLKLGSAYKYVDQLGYDEYEQRVYLRYGNGTETNYAYDDLRRRLTTLTAATASNRLMMDNTYTYDAVSNILNISNAAKAEKDKLGGTAEQIYKYDNLYRLVNAKGKYQGFKDSAGYNLTMDYDNLYNIVNKKMVSLDGKHNYNQAYTYAGNPHQATKIGPVNYSYDLNGNSLGSIFQRNIWDEENRLMGVLNNNILSEYTYDAGGERIIKSSGGIKGSWVNGSPAGTINHYDDYTVYVSPYLVYTKSKFTKHIYIEGQRIASKIGTGSFTNTSFPQAPVSAGGIDYIKRAEDLQSQRLEYYKSLGASPGPPTDKLYYAEHPSSGMAPPISLDKTASSIPAGWPGNTTPPVKGPPIFVQPIPSNDSVKAGYGFKDAGQLYEINEYFYHSDHLGSTSYITNNLGEVSQHVEYSAFGETLFEERQGSLNTPYLFNAKEKDIETGYYYYGARYYDAITSQWLGVDPMVDKYAGLSPYNYTFDNPLRYIDPNGKDIEEYARVATSALLNVSPVGELKGIAEAYTGKDLVTGQKLAWWERGLGVLPVVGGIAKGAISAARVVKGVEAVNALRTELRTVDNVTSTVNTVEDGVKLLNPRITTTERGLAHTLDRHTVNGIGRWANKSKFFNATEVEGLIQAGTQMPMIRQSNGNFARIVDAGKNIGIDRVTGNPTSTYTIITDKVGNLVTAFPGRP